MTQGIVFVSLGPLNAREGQVLAITAFDPPGTTRSRECNAAANAQLWKDILGLPLMPSLAWRSFGFDVEEGWREDGFCLAFEKGQAETAREAVLSLARSHLQGIPPNRANHTLLRLESPRISINFCGH